MRTHLCPGAASSPAQTQDRSLEISHPSPVWRGALGLLGAEVRETLAPSHAVPEAGVTVWDMRTCPQLAQTRESRAMTPVAWGTSRPSAVPATQGPGEVWGSPWNSPEHRSTPRRPSWRRSPEEEGAGALTQHVVGNHVAELPGHVVHKLQHRVAPLGGRAKVINGDEPGTPPSPAPPLPTPLPAPPLSLPRPGLSSSDTDPSPPAPGLN